MWRRRGERALSIIKIGLGEIFGNTLHGKGWGKPIMAD
jgi:hypothetical protein